jgi:outer membrane receptor protein involved in Fe transport
MIIPLRGRPAAALLLLALAAPAAAQQEAPPPPARLPPVLVTAPPATSSSSEILIPGRDFELRPQGRPADVLRLVPGLVLSQHQGGGKAEQYFLRGFDADHGTDVAIFVDGLPVNLRSHAHGQGYADLHFLIPETVRRVEAFKGPYWVEFGDFATAGAVNFVTHDVFKENIVESAGGMFGTQRHLALLSPTRDALKTVIAVEGYVTDGPFDHPSNYERFNAFTKATLDLGEGSALALSASHYRGAWHGSGEIPARAVRARLIDRFGSIDPTEGGVTQRTNVNAELRWRAAENHAVVAHAYLTYYALDLFNNFTFFLDDPENGDGLFQMDRGRMLAGGDAQYEYRTRARGVDLAATGGVQARVDRMRVILAHQSDRRLLERVQDVNVLEQSYSPFVKLDLAPLAWLRLVTGARGDVFHYDVSDNLHGAGGRVEGNALRARPSVKSNVVVGPWAETELFANFGTGFHSNDARAVTQDPRMTALPEARGYEFGVRTRAIPRVEVSATYWVLDLASELVFVGDEGTTEARGPSHREGWELATRVRLLDWLTFTGDVTTTRARFDAGGAVPLAPRVTARADLTARLPWGLAASLGMRHLGDRYADEERRQTARGYTLFDVTARYRYSIFELFASIENLTNTDWREAQFFFTSRLPGEPAGGVPDIHFTPGNPRTVLGGVAVRF